MEGELLRLEAAFRAREPLLGVAATGAAEGFRRVHVEDKGPVGPQAAHGHVVEQAQALHVEAPAIALIDDGRVRIAVAEDHHAPVERGADDFGHMLRPVREKEEKLGLGADVAFRIEQKGA